MPKTGVVIAIDGPAGAGKSTLAFRLARVFGLPYLNTGLMYRALAARALFGGIDPEDAHGLAIEVRSMSFSLSEGPTPHLLVEGRAGDPSFVSPEVEGVVSTVARHPEVRELMRQEQRSLGAGGCVMEGRDIGTVVFPDADVKIFLSAAPDVRALRRQRERAADELAGRAVLQRDTLDARTNPFVPGPDAHVLDTTSLTRDDVFSESVRIVSGAIGRGTASSPRTGTSR